jgi:hypothetical protein
MAPVRRRLEGSDNWDDELIKRERAEGDRWVKAYQDFEDDLIRSGKDPDDAVNLAPFYAQYGPRELRIPPENLSERMVDAVGFGPHSTQAQVIEFLAGTLFVGLLVLLGIRRLLRRRARRVQRLESGSAS